jgi:predicted transposase YbfD/YdcC
MKKLKQHLLSIKDPRIERRKAHSLVDIVLLTLIAHICGYEGWEMIEEFGINNVDFLKQYLELKNGIPSHDTIERLFKRINPTSFETFLRTLNKELSTLVGLKLIHVDGKTLRGSRLKNKGAIHIIHAWSSENQLLFGQIRSEAKSNEIQGVKDLLKLIDIKGSLITADAMSCQTEIATQIVEQEADYLLCVKDNTSASLSNHQKTLHLSVAYEFNTKIPDSKIVTELEKNHGRVETRTCEVLHNLSELENKEKWTGLKSIIKITSQRETNGIKTTAIRYYISSKKENATYFLHAVRAHWSVENDLHWMLDVQLKEDDCKIRTDSAAENIAIVRRIALNMITNVPYKRLGVNNRQKIAATKQEYLNQILKF